MNWFRKFLNGEKEWYRLLRFREQLNVNAAYGGVILLTAVSAFTVLGHYTYEEVGMGFFLSGIHEQLTTASIYGATALVAFSRGKLDAYRDTMSSEYWNGESWDGNIHDRNLAIRDLESEGPNEMPILWGLTHLRFATLLLPFVPMVMTEGVMSYESLIGYSIIPFVYYERIPFRYRIMLAFVSLIVYLRIAGS